jgi:hypothetical protein
MPTPAQRRRQISWLHINLGCHEIVHMIFSFMYFCRFGIKEHPVNTGDIIKSTFLYQKV